MRKAELNVNVGYATVLSVDGILGSWQLNSQPNYKNFQGILWEIDIHHAHRLFHNLPLIQGHFCCQNPPSSYHSQL